MKTLHPLILVRGVLKLPISDEADAKTIHGPPMMSNVSHSPKKENVNTPRKMEWGIPSPASGACSSPTNSSVAPQTADAHGSKGSREMGGNGGKERDMVGQRPKL